MLDIGFSELVLFAVVALVVLGPEKLPHAARIAGAWVGRIRRTVSSMQAEIEREVAAQEMKARMEKMEQDIRNMGVGTIISDLRTETRAMEEGLREVQQQAVLQDAVTAPATPVAAPEPAFLGEPAASADTVPAPAVPLDQVEMDGEKAYREWLESQKRNRIMPPASAPTDDAAS